MDLKKDIFYLLMNYDYQDKYKQKEVIDFILVNPDNYNLLFSYIMRSSEYKTNNLTPIICLEKAYQYVLFKLNEHEYAHSIEYEIEPFKLS